MACSIPTYSFYPARRTRIALGSSSEFENELKVILYLPPIHVCAVQCSVIKSAPTEVIERREQDLHTVSYELTTRTPIMVNINLGYTIGILNKNIIIDSRQLKHK